MKTDKFERTIRRKLESISPDFQESDWSKMQNYMHANTPPTFWQQYGSWIGYAAAASVTSVMAFMYVNQLSQNNHLLTDVKHLQSQIEVIKNQPVAIPKTDTIYIVQKEISTQAPQFSPRQQRLDEELQSERMQRVQLRKPDITRREFAAVPKGYADKNEAVSNQRELARAERPIQLEVAKSETVNSQNEQIAYQRPTVSNNSGTIASGGEQQHMMGSGSVLNGYSNENSQGISENNITGSNNGSSSAIPPIAGSASNLKTLDNRFGGIKEQTQVQSGSSETRMRALLANRLSPKQVRKAWMATTAANYKNPLADKKTEQVTQTENVIPKLNLKVPYRFGAGIQSEPRITGKTITAEVLVSKKFSISSGITWLRVKPVEFFTEKMFRDKNHNDFKQLHPNQVPRAFTVLNIKVDPSIVQIPLTVAFRNEMKNDWAYFVGAGTNVIVSSKEKISYDCIVPNPNNEYLSDSFKRKMDIPAINSVNFSAGLEKSFHPIVIQAEGYLYTYFKPLTPLNQKAGPGFKVKLLYQIGRKM